MSFKLKELDKNHEMVCYLVLNYSDEKYFILLRS